MINTRALVVSIIVACGSAHLAGQQETVPKAPQQKQRLCGRVVSISCFDSRFPNIFLAVSHGELVLLRLESDEGRRPWPYASQLRHREACAIGQLTQKGTAFYPALFTIANISAIALTREDQTDDWIQPSVATSCDAGVQHPTLTKVSQPNYPREAAAAGIEGAVLVEGIVETDGRIRRTRVLRPLDIEYGLDVEAANTVKRWRFVAATKDGEPTPFLMTTQVSFTLKRERP